MSEILINIDTASQSIIIENGQDRLSLRKVNDRQYVDAKAGLNIFTILKLSGSKLRISTANGGILPLYYRIEANGISFSNYPHLLIRSGDAITISAQILASRLIGASNQLYNPFISIPMLQDSSVYEFENGQIRYAGSTLHEDDKASYQSIRDFWIERFRSYAKEDGNICVPLSGGYDSRLNLAMAAHAAEDMSKLVCVHEYKDDIEQGIAREVADKYDVPLIMVGRNDMLEQGKALSLTEDYILKAGLNRDNVRRWTCHLSNVIASYGDKTRIIGFGAEPHKGKFYRQIESLDEIPPLFFTGRRRVKEAVKLIHDGKEKDFHDETLHSLISQAKQIYTKKSSQIDYVHYFAYVVDSYGYRSRYFADMHDIDFPQFNHGFLNTVFSLPREEKEAFLLNRRMMDEFGSPVANVPYTSANQKSLDKKMSFISKLYKYGKARLGPRQLKGWRDDVGLRSSKADSVLTTSLLKILDEKNPLFSRNEIITAYNYFSLLQDKYNVDYKLI
ncbi:MAG: hypothetical protein DI586_10390 [Micavibrio aeruginosavorus]|uniref:Asparagine synthetase domain-containing protein n=1 Tax=Micavibrio aeruginosavorus TaxID=349221 RepID=A0A2W5HJT2_9BACT|nr:MAG: hypothetical protein DI586_10390 [Micavibrio aeruginosavorus]